MGNAELIEKIKSLYLDFDYDADVDYFSRFFDESKDKSVLEIGSNEEPVANILSMIGFNVIGVDTRDYIEEKRKFGNLPLNFKYVKADFNSLNIQSSVDVIIALSTIEHTGLTCYGNPFYYNGDAITMMNIWRALKPGGKAYITVPVGRMEASISEWNVYSKEDLTKKIIQNFIVERKVFFCSDNIEGYRTGSEISEELAFSQNNPNVTVLLILRKGEDNPMKTKGTKITMSYQVEGRIVGSFELPFDVTDKVLEVGCGDIPLMHNENWKTMDYRAIPNIVDIAADLEKPWPINDNAYDGVYGVFVIEHMTWRKTPFFISECFRVLKPGGHVYMVGPNTLEQCRKIVAKGDIGIEESCMLFGGQDEGGWNAHKAAFSPNLATKLFAEAGFTDIRVTPYIGAITDMTTVGTKPISQSTSINDIKLNIGSFTVMAKGWINCDILPMSDFAKANGFEFNQFDASKGIPYHNDSVSLIAASHFLEHLTREEGLAFLKECYRVMKVNGVIRIAVPDAKILAKKYLDGTIKQLDNEDIKKMDNSAAFIHMLIGGHKSIYDEESLVMALAAAGFTNLAVYPAGVSRSNVIKQEIKDMYPDHSIYIEGSRIDTTHALHDINKQCVVTTSGISILALYSSIRYQWIINQTNSTESIIDLGIGPLNFWPSGWQVTTLDERSDYLPSIVAKAEHNPVPDKSYDTVVLGDILEHFSNPNDLLNEAYRIAKHKIVITVPWEANWSANLNPLTSTHHKTFFTKDSLAKLLASYGHTFTTEEIIEDFSAEQQHWSWIGAVINLDKDSPPAVLDKIVDPIIKVNEEHNHVEVKDKLRIGLISTQFFNVPPTGYSGLERVVWDLAMGLDASGHLVRIFGPDGSQATPHGEVVTTGKSLSTVNTDWLGSENAMFEVYKDKISDLDIVHGHNWFGIEYKLKMNNPKIKVCHTHHGHLNPEYWVKSKPPFKLNFVAISKFMQQEYMAAGLDSEYAYNGIDMDKYKFQEKKGENLIFVGRLDTFKQPHVAINVAKKTGLKLDIFGGSFVQDQAYLKQIIDSCDGKQIIMHLDASQDEKVKFTQNAKCLLFPSKMGEPFGLVAIEAMACGTPVIALNDGAIKEVIGEQAFIADNEDDMCKMTKRVGTFEPAVLRVFVEKNYSQKVCAARYETLYKRILAGNEW